jgi:hypothetical protein
MDFASVVRIREKQLIAELEFARSTFNHKGLRGASVESAFRDFVERHLPRSISVGTGQVFASTESGSLPSSGQIDVVICNDTQPFASARDTEGVFFIEGVIAAGEIKSTISRSKIRRELDKSIKFKSLESKIIHRNYIVEHSHHWINHFFRHRPYFLFSFENSGDWRGILLEIMDFIKQEKIIPIDAIFLLQSNIAIFISPDNSFPLTDSEGIPFLYDWNGKSVSGSIYIFQTDLILAWLLLWISIVRNDNRSQRDVIDFYLTDDLINKSLSPINMFRSKRPPEEIKREMDKDLFEFVRGELQSFRLRPKGHSVFKSNDA